MNIYGGKYKSEQCLFNDGNINLYDTCTKTETVDGLVIKVIPKNTSVYRGQQKDRFLGVKRKRLYYANYKVASVYDTKKGISVTKGKMHGLVAKRKRAGLSKSERRYYGILKNLLKRMDYDVHAYKTTKNMRLIDIQNKQTLDALILYYKKKIKKYQTKLKKKEQDIYHKKISTYQTLIKELQFMFGYLLSYEEKVKILSKYYGKENIQFDEAGNFVIPPAPEKHAAKYPDYKHKEYIDRLSIHKVDKRVVYHPCALCDKLGFDGYIADQVSSSFHSGGIFLEEMMLCHSDIVLQRDFKNPLDWINK